MKKLILLICLFVGTKSIAQSVTIDPKSTANGIINAQSNNKGIVLPSNANPPANIVAPAAGTMVYNSTSQTPNFYNGSAWQSVTASSAASLGFRNSIIFDTPGSQSWTVPVGVNKIMIEAWGGGAGGEIYSYNSGYLQGAGGAAGGYSILTKDVNPNEVIVITVGAGGVGEYINNLPTSGGFTYAKINQDYIFVTGGGDINGQGGFGTIQGESGHELELSYGNASATNHNLIVKLGSGGSAYKGGGGKGGWFVSENSNALLYVHPNTY